jgi:hypothetical protein
MVERDYRMHLTWHCHHDLMTILIDRYKFATPEKGKQTKGRKDGLSEIKNGYQYI